MKYRIYDDNNFLIMEDTSMERLLFSFLDMNNYSMTYNKKLEPKEEE